MLDFYVMKWNLMIQQLIDAKTHACQQLQIIKKYCACRDAYNLCNFYYFMMK